MNNAQALQLLQSRIGSADWSKWGIYRWQFYDYVRYPAAGSNQLQFFVNPVGSQDPNSTLQKTTEVTNCPKARSFGQVFFVIQEIRMHLHILPKNRQPAAISGDADVLFTTMDNCMDELYNIMGLGVLNFTIGQKKYFEIYTPLRKCPPGFGVHIYNHSAVAAQLSPHWLQQSPRARDVYAVTPAQMIEPEQTLDVTLDYPNGAPAVLTNLVSGATPAVDIGLILDGYIARPAQ